jgi:hypothetical protein
MLRFDGKSDEYLQGVLTAVAEQLGYQYPSDDRELIRHLRDIDDGFNSETAMAAWALSDILSGVVHGD